MRLAKKGMPWDEFAKVYREGKPPLYAIEDEKGKPFYVYSEKEWKQKKAAYMEQRRLAMTQKAAEAGEDTGDVTEEELLSEVKELWEIPKMAAILKKFEAVGFDVTKETTLTEGPKPLYRVKAKEESRDVRTLEELVDAIKEAGKQGASIQRYKGLGEMNPGQLWETTMDPANRRFLRVQLEDAVEAENIFSTLMGDKVEPRRAFIETHALDVQNLDV